MFRREPAKIAARISPTNLGFLLNARQVACEFGYLTVPEFVEQTTRTLETVTRLTEGTRPSVQLVRHAHAGARSSAFHFHRRQRQPGRFADFVEGRLP